MQSQGSVRWLLAGVLLLVVVAASMSLWLRPAEVSAEPGMSIATLTTPSGEVTLELTATRLEPGAAYMATIRALADSGAEGGSSASAGVLGKFVAGEDGVGRLTTTTATIAAGAEVGLTSDLFASPGALVSLVDADGNDVADATLIGAPSGE